MGDVGPWAERSAGASSSVIISRTCVQVLVLVANVPLQVSDGAFHHQVLRKEDRQDWVQHLGRDVRKKLVSASRMMFLGRCGRARMGHHLTSTESMSHAGRSVTCAVTLLKTIGPNSLEGREGKSRFAFQARSRSARRRDSFPRLRLPRPRDPACSSGWIRAAQETRGRLLARGRTA